MSRSTSVVGGAFPCSKCDRAFVSKPALTMHINRVHKKSVRVPGQRQSEEERLAKKRAYNRKYRLRRGMKVRTASQKEPKQNGVWTPERRAKFERTWRSKNKLRRNHELLSLEDEVGRETIPDPRQFINCCPNCGYNLKAHYLAAGFKAP